MKRWLWLLILTLVPVAVADTLDFQASGTLKQGTASFTGSFTPGSIWSGKDVLNEVINLTTGHSFNHPGGTITITTGVLFSCAFGLCWNGGSVDVDSKTKAAVFDSAIATGVIFLSPSSDIVNFIMASGAGGVIKTKDGAFSTEFLTRSPRGVVPEPGTLALFGTGWLILVWFIRRHKKEDKYGHS